MVSIQDIYEGLESIEREVQQKLNAIATEIIKEINKSLENALQTTIYNVEIFEHHGNYSGYLCRAGKHGKGSAAKTQYHCF